jgi:hypothetical protein
VCVLTLPLRALLSLSFTRRVLPRSVAFFEGGGAQTTALLKDCVGAGLVAHDCPLQGFVAPAAAPLRGAASGFTVGPLWCLRPSGAASGYLGPRRLRLFEALRCADGCPLPRVCISPRLCVFALIVLFFPRECVHTHPAHLRRPPRQFVWAGAQIGRPLSLPFKL